MLKEDATKPTILGFYLFGLGIVPSADNTDELYCPSADENPSWPLPIALYVQSVAS